MQHRNQQSTANRSILQEPGRTKERHELFIKLADDKASLWEAKADKWLVKQVQELYSLRVAFDSDLSDAVLSSDYTVQDTRTVTFIWRHSDSSEDG